MNLSRYQSLDKAFLLRVIAALLLALSLSISLADLFIPLFWERRLLLRLGFILMATIWLALPIVPVLSRFMKQPSAALPPAQRFFWLLLPPLLLGLVVIVIAGAAPHVLQVAPGQYVGSRGAGHNPGLDILASLNRVEEVIFLFVFVLFLAVATGAGEHLLTSSQHRARTPLVFLGFCFLAAYFLNNLLPLIDTNTWVFHFPDMDFPFPQTGADFRIGLYRSAQGLLSGSYKPQQNLWPPLATALGLPYLLLSENKAYLVHVVLLFVFNVFCVSLAALMTSNYLDVDSRSPSRNAGLLHVALFFLMLLGLLQSQPFLFSLERGNIDIIAMAFALASIWVLLKYPSRIWLQVLLLSIAVHLKIYPAALFSVLYYVKRSKIVLPSLLVNTGLLFVLGPANAVGFLENIPQRLAPPDSNWNHSADEAARLLANDLDATAAAHSLMLIFFTCLPVLIWLTAWMALLRFRNVDQAVLGGFMISVPLMDVLPGTSFDYKSVVLSCAVLVLLAFILVRMRTQQSFLDYLQLLMVSMAMMLIARSDTLMPQWPSFLQNKYIWIVCLELLMLVTVVQQLPVSRAEATQATTIPG